MHATLLLLTLALSAGDGSKKAPKAPAPGAACTDQCEQLSAMCTQGCAIPGAKRTVGKDPCKESCDQISSTCKGSCREKGTIDEEYMRTHMKLPQGKKSGNPDRDSDDAAPEPGNAAGGE